MKNVLLFTMLFIGSIVFSQDINADLIINNGKIINTENGVKFISFMLPKHIVNEDLLLNIKKNNNVLDVNNSNNEDKSLLIVRSENTFTINDYQNILKLANVDYVCVDNICTDIKYFKLSDTQNPPVILQYEKAGISGTLDHCNSIIEQINYKIYSHQTSEQQLLSALKYDVFSSLDKHLKRYTTEKQNILNR